MIFVTTKAEDRFVIFLKTNVCQVVYDNKELSFESTLDKLVTMKDFLLNFGVNQIELREFPDNRGALLIKDEVHIQLEDRDSIRGISVPVFTLL